MPVYHFTFHAYGTWLPDKPRWFVRRHRGVRPADRVLANIYRAQMVGEAVRFDPGHGRALRDELLRGQPMQRYRLLALAVEPTHLHAVVAWSDGRDALAVRTRLRASLTRMLNRRFGKRAWFVRNASQKRVAEPEHLAHLVGRYLPSHRGLFWRADGPGSRGE